MFVHGKAGTVADAAAVVADPTASKYQQAVDSPTEADTLVDSAGRTDFELTVEVASVAGSSLRQVLVWFAIGLVLAAADGLVDVAPPRPVAKGGRGLVVKPPRKASTKNYGSTFGCFGRLQSLITLN